MGKFAAFKLPLKGMECGTHEYEYVLDTEFFRNMESSDIRKGEVKVHLTVDCKGDIYNLDFTFAGVVNILCDRCLDEMEHEVDTAYHLCVKYGETYSDENDELLVIPESDNYLNIAYMLYDSVALTIPLKHVHPAGKCNKRMTEELKKHSAHKVGEDDDETLGSSDFNDVEEDIDNNNEPDPRWEALRKLTDNN